MRGTSRVWRALLVVLLSTTTWFTTFSLTPAVATPAPSGRSDVRLPVGAEFDGTRVSLDMTVFTPASSGDGAGAVRHPALLLAHGFGGSKDDLAGLAADFADRGYVVATYSARGMGASGGNIHLVDPAFEVADASAILTWLAARDDVQLDGDGDPRVGVAGASYGGALALMLAGADRRVDAVVSQITWNDLADAFFPAGVFKQRWASSFFATGTVGALPADLSTCGRFDPTICREFVAASTTGRADAALLSLLRRHSPAPTLSAVRAPTLLMQGMVDSLFGVDQVMATARAIATANPSLPLSVQWFDGGHDGGAFPSVDSTLVPWFRAYVAGPTRWVGGGESPDQPLPRLTVSAPSLRRTGPVRTLRGPDLPGAASVPVALTIRPADGFAQATRLTAPPGGQPAAMTLLPGGLGLDALATSGAAYRLAALPGQSAAYDVGPVTQSMTVVGAPSLRLRVVSSTTDATLFVSFWRVAASGATLPRRLVTPVRVVTRPGVATDVLVSLPEGTYALDAGSTWRVLVSTTESGFAVPRDARAYAVSLAGPTLTLPTLPSASAPADDERDREVIGLLVALAVTLAVLAGVVGYGRWRRRRSDARARRDDLADVPLVVENLVKTYRDGHRAVNDVSWRAESGQVVGLLGPNGAGKTTTMRMILGLIAPDSGTVHVLGEPVRPGTEVLADVGCLVEGPGFLPHLTGRANLQAYWLATGRPEAEAHLDEALVVAALGDAIDRPVRSYSHGMKQRLGIAQAMLGRPRVLLLDEPTNGLDPPQIAAMRPILHAYAATGRTVVVSSHLLAEVEATCSHVVVMHRGRVVASGAVSDLVESVDVTVVELAGDDDHAAAVAAALPSAWTVDVDGARLVLTAPGLARAQVVGGVVAAGGQIVSVGGRRRLEEVFLGVIAHSDADVAAGEHVAGGVRIDPERLRQVRSR